MKSTPINSHFYGEAIADIHENHFSPWFCPYDDAPALVLASVQTVPCFPSQDWFLGYEQCDGHGCNHFFAAVLPLKIIPQKLKVLERIASEDFCPDTLDYFCREDDVVKNRIRKDYQSFVRAAGLTCSDSNAAMLTQPLYPLDATESNLKALTSDSIDLKTPGVGAGLVLLIVGSNCD